MRPTVSPESRVKRVQITIPPPILAMLDALARRANVSRSAMIAALVRGRMTSSLPAPTMVSMESMLSGES